MKDKFRKKAFFYMGLSGLLVVLGIVVVIWNLVG